MIYPSDHVGILKIPGTHDPDSKRLMGIIFRPNTWAANTVYNWKDSGNYDVILPVNFEGFYHAVVNPGKSNQTTEPNWVKTKDGLTEDFRNGQTEGLTWKAIPYNLMPLDETITLAAFTATNGVTVSLTSHTDTNCQFMIDAIGSTAAARTIGSFQVKAHITKSNGEEFDVTLLFKLGEH